MQIFPVNYPPASFPMTQRPISAISDLIIHHSAGPLGQTPLDIDREHRNQGWSMIGYNYIITPDGKCYFGRAPAFIPAAAYGRNTESLNVCVIGNFQHDDAGYSGPPSTEQLRTLRDLTVHLHQHFPIVRTIGHRDVASLFFDGDSNYATACPGSELYALLPQIKRYCAQHMNH